MTHAADMFFRMPHGDGNTGPKHGAYACFTVAEIKFAGLQKDVHVKSRRAHITAQMVFDKSKVPLAVSLILGHLNSRNG